MIRQKLALALQGKGQVIGIKAEAGMGKSRLLAEAVRQAYRSGFTGYGGASEASGMNTAYLVWKPIWQAFFNIDLAASQRRQYRHLEGEIEDRAPARLQAIPMLSSLLDISIEENEFTRTLEPKDRRNVLTTLLEDCLKSAAPEEPHLLVLEDIHWIDPLSHDLLESLARVCMNLPVCILVTYRPPDAVRLQKERVEALAHFTQLELAALNAAETEQLVRAKLVQLYPEQVANIPESLVAILNKRAEGNPFYIEELLNYLHDRGLNPYTLRSLESFDLPSSLHALILSRIDQLTEAQKISLKVASIIGRLFQVSWLQGYYPSLGQEAQLKTNLAELARTNLTVLDTPEPELAYFFKHVLTRDVVYESLAYATRAQLHEQLAQFLESLDEERYLDLVAYHYGLSENTDKQIEYFQKAGDTAKAAYANEVALEYYERLEPLLVEPDAQICLHLNRGDICELIGKLSETEAEYRAALELSEQTGAQHHTIHCQRALGNLFRMKSDYTSALEWLELARTGAQESGDWLEQAQALRDIGRVNKLIGNTASALEHYRASLKLAKENQNQQMEAKVLLSLSQAFWVMGEYITAQQIAEDGLRIMQAVGNKEGISNELNLLGLIAGYRGDKITAKDYYEKSLSISREIGDKWTASATLNNLGMVASNQIEAKMFYAESLAITRELGDKPGEGILLNNLGILAAGQADYTSARAYYEESLELFRAIDNKPGCANALLNLGYVACEQDELARARALLQESLGIYQDMESKWGVIYSLIGLSVIYAGQKQHQTAVKLASAAEAMRSSIQLALEMDGTRLYERAISIAHAALSASDFEAAWNFGSQLTIEDAIALALSTMPKIAPD